MHAVYTKDPFTNKLAAFKLPDGVDVVTQEGREYLISGVRADFKPGDKTPVLVMIDTQHLTNEQDPDVEQDGVCYTVVCR